MNLIHFCIHILFLHLARCYTSECQKGYISHNGSCVPCPSSCSRCIEKSDFIICPPGKALQNHECLDKCPEDQLLFHDEACEQNLCIDPPTPLNISTTQIILDSSTVRRYNNRKPDVFLIKGSKSRAAILISGLATKYPNSSEIEDSTLLKVFHRNGTRLLEVKVPYRDSYSEPNDPCLQLRVNVTVGVAKPFSIVLTQNTVNFQDPVSYFWRATSCKLSLEDDFILFLGGSLEESFLGELSAVIVKSFPEIPNLLSHINYGVEHIKMEKFFLDNDINKTNPKIFKGNDSFGLNVTLSGMTTIKVHWHFLDQDIGFLDCSILSMRSINPIYDQPYTRLTTFSFRHLDNLRGFTWPQGIFTYYSIPNSDKAIWVGNETSFRQLEMIELVFGAAIEHSCHYLPYQLTIHQGGGGFYSLPSDPCSERDLNLDICFGCKEGYIYNIESRNCTENPHGRENLDKCFNNGFCLSQYHTNKVLPFCKDGVASFCSSCEEGFETDSEGHCVPICESGFFAWLNKTAKAYECQRCEIHGCNKCESFEVCRKCQEGWFFLESTCVEKCRPGEYKLATNKCSPVCPGNHYVNKSDQGCYHCGKGCASCETNVNCTECENGYRIYNGICYPDECFNPERTYGSSCPPCPENCLNCYLKNETFQVCTQCIDLFVLFENKACVIECPKDYFKRGNTCVYCPRKLLMPDQTEICALQCPEGYYPLFINNIEQDQCLSCPEYCGSCNFEFFSQYIQPRCSSCRKGVLIQGGCIEDCLAPFVPRGGYCKAPSEYNYNGVNCKRYSKHYKLIQMERICHPIEIKTSYLLNVPFTLRVNNKEERVIVNFDSMGKNCRSFEANGHCTSCNEGFYLAYSTYCTKFCPVGTYGDDSQNTCNACLLLCDFCDSEQNCIVWDPNVNNQAGESPLFSHYQLIFYTLLEYNDNSFFEKKFKIKPQFAKVHRNKQDMLDSVLSNTLEDNIYINWYQAQYEVSMLVFINQAQDICDPSCLICQKSQDTLSSAICLRCLPQLENSTNIEHDRCVCPSDRPFFDHIQNACVTECPQDSLIINDTKECVKTCMDVSYFSRDAFVYKLGKYCLNKCPENYSPEVDWPVANEVRCRLLESYSSYYSALQMRSQVSSICSQTDSECKLQDATNLDTTYLSLVNSYITNLVNDSMATDILFEERSHEMFFHYITSQKHLSNITSILSLFINFGYACQTRDDAFYLLSSLNAILLQYFNVQSFVDHIPALFDSIVDCFNALSSKNLTGWNRVYRGEALTCRTDEVEHTQPKEEFKLEQKIQNVNIRISVNTYSFLRHPYTTLICEFDYRTTPKDRLSFYLLSLISKYKSPDWWYADVNVKLNYDEVAYHLVAWVPQRPTFAHVKNSEIEAHFNFSQESNHLMLLISDMKSQLVIEETIVSNLLVLYISFSVIGLVLIGLLLTIVKKLSKQYNVAKKIKNKNSESVIKFHKHRRYRLDVDDENHEEEDDEDEEQLG